MSLNHLGLNLPNHSKAKISFECVSLFLFALYIFSIGAFSGRPFYNYISLVIGVFVMLIMMAYVFVFYEIKIDLFFVLLVAFAVSFLISNVVNWSFASFPKSVFTQILMSFCMYQFFSRLSKTTFEIWAPLIVIGGLAFLILFFVHYRNQIFPIDFGNRLGSYFDNENEIAKEFGYLGVISFCSGLYGKRFFNKCPKIAFVFYKILCFNTWFFSLFAILTTGSISNILVLIFVTLIACFFKIKRKLYKIIFVISVVISFLLVFLILQLPSLSYFYSRLLKMLNTFFNGGSEGDASANLRLYAMIQYIQLFFLRPLFGFGYGQGKMFTAYNMVAHSTIAELLTCVGLLGFLTFEILLFIPIVKTSNKKNKSYVSFALIYMALFQFFISSVYHAKFEYIFLALAYSIFTDNLSLRLLSQRLKSIWMNFSFNTKTVCYQEIDL